MDIVLRVPVKTFVYKYITAKYGSPWHLNSKCKDGRMLQEFLERAPHRQEKYASNQKILEIVIPSRIFMQKGCFLSQARINAFIEIIHQDLMNEINNFYSAITDGIGLKKYNVVRVDLHEPGQKIKTRRLQPSVAPKFFEQREIIYDVLKKYDITEDDLTFDSLKKHLYRSTKIKN